MGRVQLAYTVVFNEYYELYYLDNSIKEKKYFEAIRKISIEPAKPPQGSARNVVDAQQKIMKIKCL